MLGKESKLRHSLPSGLSGRSDSSTNNDNSLVQWASHIPSEHHLLLDYAIAALDPIYALTPVLFFAAASENGALGVVTKQYEIITSTVWDPKLYKEHLEQLILHKHILDDHACRHEEVLHFLRSSASGKWCSSLTAEQAKISNEAKKSVENDYEYLLTRTRQFSTHHQEAISILVSSVALTESKKQITLATQVTKLTIFATVFLPLSYCTSVFGMNFVVLEQLSIWVWVIVTAVIGVATFVVYQWDERSDWLQMRKRVWTNISKITQRRVNQRDTEPSIV